MLKVQRKQIRKDEIQLKKSEQQEQNQIKLKDTRDQIPKDNTQRTKKTK